MYNNFDTAHAPQQFRVFSNTSEYVLHSEHAMTNCIIKALAILMYELKIVLKYQLLAFYKHNIDVTFSHWRRHSNLEVELLN